MSGTKIQKIKFQKNKMLYRQQKFQPPDSDLGNGPGQSVKTAAVRDGTLGCAQNDIAVLVGKSERQHL